MATVAEIIEETRRQLLTGSKESRNKLSGDIDSSVTSIPMMYALDGIHRGSKLSIGLEDMYVWGTENLNVTPVDRGQWGSTAASHSTGAMVFVDPKFSNFEIFDAVNKELVSLSSPSNGLYGVRTTELTFNASVAGYDFPTNTVLDVLEVRYSVPGPSGEYVLSRDWDLVRNLSDEYSSGSAIMVRDAFPSRTVLVTVKAPFTQLSASLTADISATGLPSTAVDILSLGAAWRLTAPREVKRNFEEAQGSTRRADEVPPGANLGGSRELGRLRQQRVQEEAARLQQKYPPHSPRYPYIVSS